MLTDIFANRYSKEKIWEVFGETDRRFLVQGFRIIDEQIFRYYQPDGKVNTQSEKIWDSLNKELAMELGLEDLSNPFYGYYQNFNGNKKWTSYRKSKNNLCKDFILAEIGDQVSADRFIKERISFVELAFRKKEQLIDDENAKLEMSILNSKTLNTRLAMASSHPTNLEATQRAKNKRLNDDFDAICHELNTRLTQANYPFHYHNGFIQKSEDKLITKEVEEPFWHLIADPKWKNVDTDMKEAFDLRDNLGRDPAWYAAKALESCIKIISDSKSWTHGGENGPHNYIDTLASKKKDFINNWEKEILKNFFTNVRNPFAHGAGSDDMPELTDSQTNWSIRFCMNWVSTLLTRL